MNSADRAQQQLRGETARTRILVAEAIRAITRSRSCGARAGRVLRRLLTIKRQLRGVAVYLSEPNRARQSATRKLMRLMAEIQEHAETIAMIVRKTSH